MMRQLEELAINAWPSLQTAVHRGWVLRFAEGYTKRANSATPLYAASSDIDAPIAFCEATYRAKGLPPVFKMTSYPAHEAADEGLAARGYRREAHSSVQTVELRTRCFSRDAEMTFEEELVSPWLDAFCRLSDIPLAKQPTLERMLRNIVPTRCFAAFEAEGKIAACGLGVLDEGHLGLFDIVVDKTLRGRGYGRRIVEALLAWGAEREAATAWLQVVKSNDVAVGLYRSLGFEERYSYWYRVPEAAA